MVSNEDGLDESVGWCVDAVDALEAAVLCQEGWTFRAQSNDWWWRDPSTDRTEAHVDALDVALRARQRRRDETGAADALVAALDAARRALAGAAGWSCTLAASVLQDDALWLDPLDAEGAHTLAVAAERIRRRLRAKGRP